jgi:hypothetical protein
LASRFQTGERRSTKWTKRRNVRRSAPREP